MALTAYCKKCNREVEPGDICPLCGTKLAKSATHAAWVMERKPVADWMSWNAILRWLLPAGLAVVLLALVLEGMSGGVAAVERLFSGSFPVTLLILLGGVLALVLLALCLQGKELADYVVDSRGIHVTRYLPDPTAMKLILRLKSPGLLREADPEAERPILKLGETDLPWREVVRVQLWPEKCYILFYAPRWWMRAAVRCTPFSWDDALFFVRDKLGKKKAVDLPAHLRTGSVSKASVRKPAGRVASGGVSMGKAAPEAELSMSGRRAVRAVQQPVGPDPSRRVDDPLWPEEGQDLFQPAEEPDKNWKPTAETGEAGPAQEIPEVDGEQIAMEL